LKPIEKEKPGRRRDEIIAALLSTPNLEAAAKACHLSPVTLWRRLQQPDFSEAYAAARRQAVQAAVGALQQASGLAVQTLVELTSNRGTPDYVRITAARSILEFAFKGAELLDLEIRVAQLEEATKMAEEGLSAARNE